jgi:hypothetical protein
VRLRWRKLIPVLVEPLLLRVGEFSHPSLLVPLETAGDGSPFPKKKKKIWESLRVHVSVLKKKIKSKM